ncbi:MAG: hypothetical protein MI755_14095, partial [Sphingomonadales bacterium]|nr:hypothetical protein [Sphingomonadales bacterium]
MSPSPYKQYRHFIAGALVFVALALWSRPVFFLMSYEPPQDVSNVLYCAPAEAPDPSDAEAAERRQDLNNRFLENLTGASNVESRLVGALFNPGSSTATEITREFRETNPNNEFVAMHYLHACANSAEDDACNPQLLGSAAELNNDNAAAWGMLAIFRQSTGNEFGAVVAMRQAANAPTFDDLLPRNFQVMRDAIPQGASVLSDPILSYLFGPGIGLNMVNYRTSNVCSIS